MFRKLLRCVSFPVRVVLLLRQRGKWRSVCTSCKRRNDFNEGPVEERIFTSIYQLYAYNAMVNKFSEARACAFSKNDEKGWLYIACKY